MPQFTVICMLFVAICLIQSIIVKALSLPPLENSYKSDYEEISRLETLFVKYLNKLEENTAAASSNELSKLVELDLYMLNLLGNKLFESRQNIMGKASNYWYIRQGRASSHF